MSEARFSDTVMDNFFKIQGAWMNRDLSPVRPLLTDEMTRIFQEDLERLLRDTQREWTSAPLEDRTIPGHLPAVAEAAAKEASEYLAAEVPVGPHLADQLLLPMALAGGGARVHPQRSHVPAPRGRLERVT